MKWRALASLVCTLHHTEGHCAVTLDGNHIPPGFHVQDGSPSHPYVSGPILEPQSLRIMLWDWRSLLDAEGTVLWTKYFPDRNLSLYGIGKLVPLEKEVS